MSVPTAHFQPVAPAFTGNQLVPLRALRKKLGRVPAILWEVLLTRRNRDAEIHITNEGMCRLKGVEQFNNLTEIRRAISRLKRAGLLEARGWVHMRVRYRDQLVVREVYLRRVFGATDFGDRANPMAMVPAATAVWLASATGWGGKRVGAGRKRREVPAGEIAPLRASAVPSHRPPASPWERRLQAGLVPAGNQVCSTRPNSSVVPDSNTLSSIDALSGSFLSEKNVAGSGPSRAGFSEEQGQCPPPSTPEATPAAEPLMHLPAATPPQQWTPPASVPAPSVLAERTTGAGFWIGVGTGEQMRRPPMLFPANRESDAMPPIPGDSVVQAAQVPSPPQLNAALGPDGRTNHLLHIYRSAVKARSGRKLMIHMRGLSPNSKLGKQMAAAAELLIKHELPPAAWVAWSIDCYRELREKKGAKGDPRRPPSLEWTFKPERIEKLRGWFRREESRYCGGTIVKGRWHSELSQRWARCSMAVCRVMPDDVPAVVEKYFPNGLYDVLVDRARLEAVEARRKLGESMSRGEFIW